MRISDWSSDVCSSDLFGLPPPSHDHRRHLLEHVDEERAAGRGHLELVVEGGAEAALPVLGDDWTVELEHAERLEQALRGGQQLGGCLLRGLVVEGDGTGGGHRAIRGGSSAGTAGRLLGHPKCPIAPLAATAALYRRCSPWSDSAPPTSSPSSARPRRLRCGAPASPPASARWCPSHGAP